MGNVKSGILHFISPTLPMLTGSEECARICQMINNSAAECSISPEFSTMYDHVTSDLQRTP